MRHAQIRPLLAFALCASSAAPAVARSVAVPGTPSAAAAPPREPGKCRPHHLGTEVTRGIVPGETQYWAVDVKQGELARLQVRQRGTDMVVRLFDPSGEFRWGCDENRDRRGAENVLWIADRAGAWTLSIDVYPGRPGGEYQIEWTARGILEERDALMAEIPRDLWDDRSETGVYAPPPSESGRSLAVPRSDLQRVRAAQTEHFRHNGRFADYVKELERLEPSPDVLISLLAHDYGWSGTAEYADDPKHVCGVIEGDALGIWEGWLDNPRVSGVVVSDEPGEPERWCPIRGRLTLDLTRLWVEQYVRGLSGGSFAPAVDSLLFRPRAPASHRAWRGRSSRRHPRRGFGRRPRAGAGTSGHLWDWAICCERIRFWRLAREMRGPVRGPPAR